MRILYQSNITHELDDLPVYTSISSKEVNESVKITSEYGYSSNAEAYVMTFNISADLLLKSDNTKVLGYTGIKRFAFRVEHKEKELIKRILGDVISNASMYIQDNTSFYLTKHIDTDSLIEKTIQTLDDDGFYNRPQ
jgi:hypothetical protein